MSTVQALEPGSRYDLRTGISPDAPEEDQIKDEEGAFGYCHSYESSSRYDGPGLRVVRFVSGCLLRCTYCHNPDTWHLKDGTYVSVEQVLRRLGDFAPAVVDRERVAPVRHLHDLRHGGIAPLPLVGGVRDRPRHRRPSGQSQLAFSLKA